jgi:hypothetical protein
MTALSAVRFGFSQCALVAVLLASAAVRLGEIPTLVAVCLVTSAAALVLPEPWTAALGVVAWACFTGFVANQLGELTFTGPDLARLALLVTVGSAAHWMAWDRWDAPVR